MGGWPSWAGGPRGRVALVDGWPLWAGSGWMVLGLGCCDYLNLPDSPWCWKGTMVREGKGWLLLKTVELTYRARHLSVSVGTLLALKKCTRGA